LFHRRLVGRIAPIISPSLPFVYTITLTFEWDPAKNESNLRKQGIDFRDAVLIFGGPTLEMVDGRRDYGETRILTFGLLEGMEIAVVYTMRGRNRRIISARRAHTDERKTYRKAYPEIGWTR
jgi:uncharacterized DUF497 family protein